MVSVWYMQPAEELAARRLNINIIAQQCFAGSHSCSWQ
jgi:hypothetical protein